MTHDWLGDVGAHCSRRFSVEEHSTRPVLCCFMAALVLAAGCGGGGGDSGGDAGPVDQTVAPLCSEIAGSGPRELFTFPVVPTDEVRESLIFGGMDPGTLEPINFELGFLLESTNVPVVAPADLQVRAIEYTRYLTGFRAGVTDYGMSFEVCSTESAGGRVVAVQGDFQHITALSPTLQQIIDTYEFDCFVDDANPEETAEKCAYFFPSSQGPEGLVIDAGTTIGSAGGTGDNGYTPGFDFNLLDGRYANQYVNPDRIGGEEGPPRAFRYGACVYEYFVDPYRSAYMAEVGQNGDLRVSATAPCGTLSFGEEGTAAGVWILESAQDLDFDTNYVEVLESLLVLAPHHVFPEEREVISSELTEVTDSGGSAVLVEFEPQVSGDVNVSFYDMVPGTIYCIESTAFGSFTSFYHYLRLGPGGDSLTLEMLSDSCAGIPEANRSFSGAALQFVR